MPVDEETPETKQHNLGASVVRTVTPLLVGLILGFFGSKVAGLDQTTLTPVVSMVVAAVYHSVVRVLEEKWPKWGVLLGWPTSPTYTKTPEG